MMASGLKTAAPFVIAFGYNDFKQGPNKRIATCKVCGIKIKDAGSTTSNFIRHLKTHRDRYSEFISVKKEPRAEGQKSLDSFCVQTRHLQEYSQGNPRQIAITESITQDLIISCNLPLSFIDNPNFKNFLSVVEERYSPVSQSSITSSCYECTSGEGIQSRRTYNAPPPCPA